MSANSLNRLETLQVHDETVRVGLGDVGPKASEGVHEVARTGFKTMF